MCLVLFSLARKLPVSTLIISSEIKICMKSTFVIIRLGTYNISLQVNAIHSTSGVDKKSMCVRWIFDVRNLLFSVFSEGIFFKWKHLVCALNCDVLGYFAFELSPCCVIHPFTNLWLAVHTPAFSKTLSTTLVFIGFSARLSIVHFKNTQKRNITVHHASPFVYDLQFYVHMIIHISYK